MNEAKPEDSPWIDWHGGDMPVAPETLVLPRLRDGSVWNKPMAARFFGWKHEFGAPFDIIAYRVLSAPQPEQIAEEALPQSDTPRTDALDQQLTKERQSVNTHAYIKAIQLARQLERELSVADRQEAFLQGCLLTASKQLAALKAREPAASASMDEKAADIAKEFGRKVHFGQDGIALAKNAILEGMHYAQSQREQPAPRPTIHELEAILTSDEELEIQMLPNGEIRAEKKGSPTPLDAERREQPAEERGGISPAFAKMVTRLMHLQSIGGVHAPNDNGQYVRLVADIRAALSAPPAPEQAAKGDEAEWKQAVQAAYGILWLVNDEPGTPEQFSSEMAAHEARKLLRELLTVDERQKGVNAARAKSPEAGS